MSLLLFLTLSLLGTSCNAGNFLISLHINLSQAGFYLLIAAPGAWGEGIDDVDPDYDPFVHLKLRAKDIQNSCPNGVEKCVCENNIEESTNGPFDPDEDLLGAIRTYSVCNPGICYCKGDPYTPRDSRNWPMKAVFDTCPRGEMNRCLCHDNSIATFPFDMRTLFLNCRPKRVSNRHILQKIN